MASRIWPFVCDYTFSAWSVRLKGIIKLNYWIRMVISKHKSAREHDYICFWRIKGKIPISLLVYLGCLMEVIVCIQNKNVKTAEIWREKCAPKKK